MWSNTSRTSMTSIPGINQFLIFIKNGWLCSHQTLFLSCLEWFKVSNICQNNVLYWTPALKCHNPFVFRTTALAAKLSDFNLGSDKHTFLSKLIKNIFSCYLESYIDMERQYLQNRSGMILQRYYDSKNHQKRPVGTGRWGTVGLFGFPIIFPKLLWKPRGVLSNTCIW